MRTRRALVRAAAEAFAEEGFVPTTLSTISRKAGVSSGALHFHFASKHDLARAVEAAAAEAVRHITGQADQRPGSALQRLVDATHAVLGSLERDVVVRAGFELVTTAARRGGAVGVVDLRGQWQRWVCAVLHTARQQGELAGGVSPADAAGAVVAASVGFEVLSVTDPAWVSRHTLSQYWELMLPRLAAPGRLAGLVPGGSGPGVLRPAPATPEQTTP
ncbi:TetR/AcrR family transcriptional regulator [Streptomyces sp. S.PNR 29]|nr:TetR/AcrR family transcriptional regulator [Streptomyces sp. S.PNR 29]